jgi:hypothetical protein
LEKAPEAQGEADVDLLQNALFIADENPAYRRDSPGQRLFAGFS